MAKVTGEKLIEAYVDAKLDLEEQELKVKEMKEEVVEFLKKQEGNIAYVGEISVYLRRTARYKYSKAVRAKEEKLKLEKGVIDGIKKEEQESGKAEVVSETFSPVVKA